MRRGNLREETMYYIGTMIIKSQVKYREDGRIKLSREDDYLFTIRYSKNSIVSAKLFKGKDLIMDISMKYTKFWTNMDIRVFNCNELKVADHDTGKLVDVLDVRDLPMVLYKCLRMDTKKVFVTVYNNYDRRLKEKETQIAITRDIHYHYNIANLGYTYKNMKTGETGLFLVRKSDTKAILYENVMGKETYYTYNRDNLLTNRQVICKDKLLLNEIYEYNSDLDLKRILCGSKDAITFDRNPYGDIMNIRKNGESIKTFLYMTDPMVLHKSQFVVVDPSDISSFRGVNKYYA